MNTASAHQPISKSTITVGNSEANSTSPLGMHYLAECHNCNLETIYDAEFVQNLLIATAKHCKASIVDTKFHHFEPYGVSGVVIIEESHFHVHTWPEHNYAAIDLFTCNLDMDFSRAVQFLEEALGCDPIQYQSLSRGHIPHSK
jgi:S-adenosylmethionine decarboxylase proenzyme